MLPPIDSGLDEASFRQLAREGDLVPCVRELVADTLTPVGAYLRLRRAGIPGFLLESAEGGERWGRYSVLGVAPRASLTRVGDTWVRREQGTEKVLDGPPLDAIRAELARSNAVVHPGLPRLAGGLVGYLGYDVVRWFEKIPDRHDRAENEVFPDSVLFRVEDCVVFDNARQRALVVAWADLRRAKNRAAALEDARTRVEAISRRLADPLPVEIPRPRVPVKIEPLGGGREGYVKGVAQALEYIRAGDIFQVVLSQAFRAKLELPPVELYRALRAVNPSPYLFLVDLGGPAVVGSSPELLVRVERGAKGRGLDMVVRPIAGTRPRGKTPDEDKALEAALRRDPKERAEHVMLVDLGRNDVGRVAELGSVRVEDLMVVERYSHVMHLVSQVRGRLAKGKDALDALAASFPAGTVSGAPKIRAMQIIDELEATRRGPYAGAVGAFSFTGEMDLALTIRAARVTKDAVTLQAGAGIVADSDAGAEWNEVNAKAAAVLRALQLAAGG